MKNKFLMSLFIGLLSCTMLFGLSVNAFATSELSDYSLSDFSSATQTGQPGILNGKTVVFNGQGLSKQDGLIFKEALNGEYSVQFDVSTKSNGSTVFMAVLGNKSIDDVGGDAQISKTDSLTFTVTAGAVDMARDGATSASGYKVYNDTSYSEVTDPIKMANTFGWFALNTYRFKFVVKENGDVDFYATVLNLSFDYPQYLYTLSKTPDNQVKGTETDGYFAFIPCAAEEVTFSNFAVNGEYLNYALDNDLIWGIFGGNHTIEQKSGQAFLKDNERMVSDFYFDDSGLSQDDVIFDVTYRVKPTGDHGWTAGGWLTMGMMFGMDSKDAIRSSSNSIETQWATLLRVCVDGAAQTKVSGDGSGAGSAYFVNGAQAVFRVVAKKGGTLDVYVSEGGNALADTVYQSFSGLDFNGYIAFYADDNVAVTSGTHNDIIFTEVSVKANPLAVKVDNETEYIRTIGAGVRLSGDAGIRFISEFSKSYLLNLDCDSYKIGTILKGGEISGELTVDTLNSVKIENAEGYYWLETEDVITISAYIFGIDEAHYGTAVSARTYIEIVKDGQTSYIYGSVITRTLSGLAQSALDDVSTEESALYPYDLGNGTFSPYDRASRDKLLSYLVI